jgi:hypothetical protein
LVPLRYSTETGGNTPTEFTIDPAKLWTAFAADLPAEQTAVMAATQRRVSELAFSEPSGIPAWKSLPSWTVVASNDKAAGTDLIRAMAERAGADITEVERIARNHDLAAPSCHRSDRGRHRRGLLNHGNVDTSITD